MVSAETRASGPNQQQLMTRKEKITFSYGQWVGLRAMVQAKLVSVCEK